MIATTDNKPFYDLDFGSDVRARWLTRDLAWLHLTAAGTPCGGLLIFGDRRHTLVTFAPVSIEELVKCPACGRQGWVRHGIWTDEGEGYA